MRHNLRAPPRAPQAHLPCRRVVLAVTAAGARKKRGSGGDSGGNAADADAPPPAPSSMRSLADFGLGADSLPLPPLPRNGRQQQQQPRPPLFAADDDDEEAAVELIDPTSDAWNSGSDTDDDGGDEDDEAAFAAALARARQGMLIVPPACGSGSGAASPGGGNRRQRRLARQAAASASLSSASLSSGDDEDDGAAPATTSPAATQSPPPSPLGPNGLPRERVFLVGVSVRSEEYARRARERREEQRRQELRTGRRPAFALAPPPGPGEDEEEEEDDFDGDDGQDSRRRRRKNNTKNSSSSVSTYGVDESLDELARLADTAGLFVVGRTSQQLSSPNAATYVGGGKVAEIVAAVRKLQADTVIFDDELSPAQLRNLERALNAPPPPPPGPSALAGRRARAAMAGAYDEDGDEDEDGGDWWRSPTASLDGDADDDDGERQGDEEEQQQDPRPAPPPPPPPAPQRPVAVADRTALILDIFSQRARTKEGKLQVALAQVEYQLPRVTRMWTHLDRVGGGGQVKGAGEKQLEIDRRLLRDRAALLRRELDGVRAHRAAHRARRTETPVPVVALVGYTNAGKSSLLNALVARCGHFSAAAASAQGAAGGGDGFSPFSSSPPPFSAAAGAGSSLSSSSSTTTLADASLADGAVPFKGAVLAEDRLFATLDPTTRRVRLKPAGTEVLVTDTVGFIQKLPTSLVAAFRATLEEIAAASVLVHVVDASSAVAGPQAEAVAAVLEEVLGGKDALARMPTVTAWNKSDAAPGGADALKRAAREAASAAAAGRRRGGRARGGGRAAGAGSSSPSSAPPHVVVVSAATGDGLDELLAALRDQLDGGWVDFDSLLPTDEAGPLISVLHRGGRVEEEDWSAAEGLVRVRGKAPKALAGKVLRMEEKGRVKMGLPPREVEELEEDEDGFASDDGEDEEVAAALAAAGWH